MTDHAEPDDRRLSSEPADPIENADRNDPIDPIDNAEPTLPIERMDPFEAMERMEFSEAMDHREDPGAFIAATISQRQQRLSGHRAPARWLVSSSAEGSHLVRRRHDQQIVADADIGDGCCVLRATSGGL